MYPLISTNYWTGVSWGSSNICGNGNRRIQQKQTTATQWWHSQWHGGHSIAPSTIHKESSDWEGFRTMTWLKSPCWACWGSGTLKILSSAFVRSPKSTSWTWCGSDFVTLDNKMTFRSSSHSLEKSQSVLATPAHHSPPQPTNIVNMREEQNASNPGCDRQLDLCFASHLGPWACLSIGEWWILVNHMNHQITLFFNHHKHKPAQTSNFVASRRCWHSSRNTDYKKQLAASKTPARCQVEISGSLGDVLKWGVHPVIIH